MFYEEMLNSIVSNITHIQFTEGTCVTLHGLRQCCQSVWLALVLGALCSLLPLPFLALAAVVHVRDLVLAYATCLSQVTSYAKFFEALAFWSGGHNDDPPTGAAASRQT